MNGGRFASLTAGLMVRKGEGRTSFASAPAVFALPRATDRFVRSPTPERAPALPAQDKARPPKSRRTAPPGDGPPAQPDKSRRLTVSVSPGEYETLGLIGVKKNVTRHQLLRNALDEYMALLVEEYAGDCQCISTGCSCGKLG